MVNKLLLRVLPVILLLSLAACASPASNSSGPVTVNVTTDDFSFQSSLTTFKVGTPYHFVVKNNGKVAHELMIVKPIEAGVMDMEAMDKMALAHIEEEDLPPGGTAEMDYTFTQAAPAGALEFACHITGHYEAGMKLPIEVQ